MFPLFSNLPAFTDRYDNVGFSKFTYQQKNLGSGTKEAVAKMIHPSKT